MKTLLLKSFLIIIISMAGKSFSQSTGNESSDSTRGKEEVKNSLKSKQWALTFGIGSNFTLTNFDDALLAVKYQFSSKSALRLDFNMDYFNAQDPDLDFTEYQNRNFGGNLSFLYYLNPKERFNIYLSLGINFSYYYYFRQHENENYYQEFTNWITGPKIGAGAEFFVFKSMSLFAEYNYIFGFGKDKYTENYIGVTLNSYDSDITSFGKNNVKFGLSVYF